MSGMKFCTTWGLYWIVDTKQMRILSSHQFMTLISDKSTDSLDQKLDLSLPVSDMGFHHWALLQFFFLLTLFLLVLADFVWMVAVCSCLLNYSRSQLPWAMKEGNAQFQHRGEGTLTSKLVACWKISLRCHQISISEAERTRYSPQIRVCVQKKHMWKSHSPHSTHRNSSRDSPRSP